MKVKDKIKFPSHDHTVVKLLLPESHHQSQPFLMKNLKDLKLPLMKEIQKDSLAELNFILDFHSII